MGEGLINNEIRSSIPKTRVTSPIVGIGQQGPRTHTADLKDNSNSTENASEYNINNLTLDGLPDRKKT